MLCATTQTYQSRPLVALVSEVSLCLSGEKRKLPEALTLEDAKRIRVMGDIPMELVNEVMMTITDPAAMLGPEVSAEGHFLSGAVWQRVFARILVSR